MFGRCYTSVLDGPLCGYGIGWMVAFRDVVKGSMSKWRPVLVVCSSGVDIGTSTV